jgi:hypothetical protein
MTGPAQTRATPNEVVTVEGPSPGGRFRSAYPLWDGTGRILVSWSQCRLLDTTVTPNVIVPCTAARLADPNVQTAPPLYSSYIFNPVDNTFKPLFQPVEGVMITDMVAAQPRTLPAVILDKVPVIDFDPDLQTQAGAYSIFRSVYDFDGTTRATGTGNPSIATLANPAMRTAAQRPARFLRIEKAVSLGDEDLGFPDIDNSAFGRVNFMREILGYVPIEPDGSVQVRVPANVAFVISILTPMVDACSPASQLAAGAPGRDPQVQRLPPGRRRHHARIFRTAATALPIQSGMALRHGRPFATEARFSPNVGETMAGACAHHLRHRQRVLGAAQRERGLH